jgi:hypothetical protein
MDYAGKHAAQPIQSAAVADLYETKTVSEVEIGQARFLPAGWRFEAAGATGFFGCSDSMLRRSASMRLITRRSGTAVGASLGWMPACFFFRRSTRAVS